MSRIGAGLLLAAVCGDELRGIIGEVEMSRPSAIRGLYLPVVMRE